MNKIFIRNIRIENKLPFTLIAGPCVMESKEHAIKMAETLTEMTKRLNIPFVFKTSFDKANRTSFDAKRGVGLENSLKVFESIREICPVITDVHTEEQCKIVSPFVDAIQIPAFLCRQTDLLKAAAKTGKAINIKKGQFLSPYDVSNIVKKMESFDCTNFALCERGTTFGYGNLVVDMRSLDIMARTGYPIIFDATHSVQEPGGGTSTGGNWKFAPILAKAAIAIGVAGIFLETHDNPSKAFSDGPNMIPLENLEEILKIWIKLDSITKDQSKTS